MSDHPPPLRLLVLDAEMSTSQHIVGVASAAGIEARRSTTVKQFLSALHEWQPTHLALDLIRPGVDELAVIRRLADIHCRLPLIFFSGQDSRVLASAQSFANTHGLNVIAALQKPFRRDSLRILLEKLAGTGSGKQKRARPTQVTERDLRLAIQKRELDVHYQPKIDCGSGAVTGFEALVRWNHAEAGLVMPDDFITLAEKSGLIHDLSEEVMRQSFAWLARSHPDLEWTLSVNLSPYSLTDRALAENLSELCSDYRLDPQRVILEVSEVGAMEQPAEALDLLTRLGTRGFQIAIDDFGRGYSSLVQLVRMPFSELKIDKAFSMFTTKTRDSMAVIKSAVDLGHSLGMRVVAEGVDEPSTLQYLRDIGCDLAQGFLISEAMNCDEVVPWMVRRRNPLHA